MSGASPTLLTGYADAGADAKTLRAPLNRLAQKPFRAEVCKCLIRKSCKQPSATARNGCF